jgi:hypothetical protein
MVSGRTINAHLENGEANMDSQDEQDKGAQLNPINFVPEFYPVDPVYPC